MPTSPRVRDYNGAYFVVKKEYWYKYKQNAFVEFVSYNYEEARYIKNSIAIHDNISVYLIHNNEIIE